MRTRDRTPSRWMITTVALLVGGATPSVFAQGAMPPGHPPVGATANSPNRYAGTVVETMDSGGYTYVLIDTGSEKIWAAGSRFEVKEGDRVSFGGGLPMTNFHSETLGRDFDRIYFTGGIRNESRQTNDVGGDLLPEGHPAIGGAPGLDLSDIAKAPGGKTVAEVFRDKAALAGKEVKVRGKVVKFTPQVMGKNWIHIKDGTGRKGAEDLTVTTEASAQVGDVVMISGKVAVDRDFGYRYQYPVLIEDATLQVERNPNTASEK